MIPKNKNKTVNVRLTEEEYKILTDLVKKEKTDIKNISEAVRFCIEFNTVTLWGA